MKCNCCGKELISGRIHSPDGMFKTCPLCSRTNGNEHVFHPYPENFGTTPARRTDNNPEGDQSYCVDCRNLDPGAPSTVHHQGKTCSEFK